jgi:hypothetical protein
MGEIIMLKKVVAGLLVFISAWLLAGCGRTETPPTENVSEVIEPDGTSAETESETESTEETTSYYVGETVLWTPEMEIRQERASFAAGPWQDAYAAFLRAPENYPEEDHHAFAFVLADLNNNGLPELILLYGNDHYGGGTSFANIYSYNGRVKTIGHQIDMYYGLCYPSTNSSFPGVFVYGGRASNFSCNYWTIKNNVFTDVPLWTDIADMESHDMVYTELISNKQLIAESKKLIYSGFSGVELSWLDEASIQKTIYGD